MLNRLLESLEKQYCYQPNRVYYNWLSQGWRMLPELYIYAESFVQEWIDELKGNDDIVPLKNWLRMSLLQLTKSSPRCGFGQES
jgi:hypothetical protein